MARKIVPDIVSNQILAVLPPETTIREAAKIMAQRRIGVVMVGSVDNLLGIFSERDMAFRVVARGVDPDVETLATIMTPNPMTIAPSDSPEEALELMREQGFRHLPVLDGARIVGMVSIRDLYNHVQNELQHDLQEREAFIFGGGYGLGA